jgi:thioredoxin 1
VLFFYEIIQDACKTTHSVIESSLIGKQVINGSLVVDKKTFTDRLKTHPRPVVIDVWATWCNPCRAIEPDIRRLTQQYKDRVDVWKVNVDEEKEIARALGVRGIPTLIIFNSGKELGRIVGAQPPSVLGGIFEAALTGERIQASLSPQDRLLRLITCLALLAVSWTVKNSVVSTACTISALFILFFTMADTFPFWRAFQRQVEDLVRKLTKRS